MNVGVIGPTISVRAVLAEAEKNTLPMACVPLDYANYVDTVELIRRHREHVDAFLFTGTTPYYYALEHLNPEVPWEYLPRSTNALLCAMLKAVYLHGCDIRRISVDSYEEGALREAYAEIGLRDEAVSLLSYPFQLFSTEYIDRIIFFHKDNLQTGKARFCLTGMQSVYERLSAERLPVAKVFATSEVILQQLQKLYINQRTVMGREHGVAALSIAFEFSRERSLYGKSELQFFKYSRRAMEAVYAFAQRVGGAVEPAGNEGCNIYVSAAVIERETESFTRLKLLRDLQEMEGVARVCIGLGLGAHPADAKYHAELGKNRAFNTSRSCFFIVNEAHTPIGPVYEGAQGRCETQVDDRLNRISRKSGVGLETLYRLERAVNVHGIETATPAELAEICGMSRGGMNRVLTKLEEHGYLKVVGKQPPSKLGRPRRLIQLLLD